jgi:hypothetical protein
MKGRKSSVIQIDKKRERKIEIEENKPFTLCLSWFFSFSLPFHFPIGAHHGSKKNEIEGDVYDAKLSFLWKNKK